MLMGKAIRHNHMIRDEDHVLIAVSSGKDSISLLWLLRERINPIPIECRVMAVRGPRVFGEPWRQEEKKSL